MSVAMPKEKARLIVDIDEPALLSSIKKAILLLKGVSAVNVKQPKVKMTENEFFSKLDLSVASQKKGKSIRMRQNESGMEFINRLLCPTK